MANMIVLDNDAFENKHWFYFTLKDAILQENCVITPTNEIFAGCPDRSQLLIGFLEWANENLSEDYYFVGFISEGHVFTFRNEADAVLFKMQAASAF